MVPVINLGVAVGRPDVQVVLPLGPLLQVVLPLIVRPENRRRLVQNLPGRGRDW